MKKNLHQNKTNQHYDFADSIMNQIHRGSIKMKPKSYFVTIAILKKTALIVGFALAIFFASLVFFKFRIYDPFGFLIFGKLGIAAFTKSVPWDIVLLCSVSTAGILYSIKKFELLFTKSFSFVSALILVVVFVGGIVLDQTGMNEHVKKSRQIPYLYDGQYFSKTWIIGEITEINYQKKQLKVLIPFDEKNITIIWNASTDFPEGDTFSKEDHIQVVGSLQGNTFQAKAIAPSSFDNPY